MKKRFSEQQILKILKEGESGISLDDLCCKHTIGQSTYYNWRAKYGGMELSDMKCLKALEEENRRSYVKKIIKSYQISLRQACELMKISRRVYYYEPAVCHSYSDSRGYQNNRSFK